MSNTEKIFRVIRGWISREGRSPTTQEVADAAGVTYKTAYKHIAKLQEKDLIHRTPRKHRGITLISQVYVEKYQQLCLFEDVPAGHPSQPGECCGTVDLQEWFGDSTVSRVVGGHLENTGHGGKYIVQRGGQTIGMFRLILR